jgi:hypothetical protein
MRDTSARQVIRMLHTLHVLNPLACRRSDMLWEQLQLQQKTQDRWQSPAVLGNSQKEVQPEDSSPLDTLSSLYW